MTDLTTKLAHLQEHLNQGLIGRKDIVQSVLLGLLAGENTLLVGPPGTAKSQLARRVSQALVSDGNDYFEYLLTKFSTPEELFGPLSLTELKQDRFHRKTEGYLPSVQVAFLDEIFKASSSILNALLTILNERTYHNGTQSTKTPLTTVIAASNELPEQSELQALYDRFLLRQFVDYLPQEQLGELLDSRKIDSIPEEYQLTADDLQAVKNKAKDVICPQPIKQSILNIWHNHKKAFADNLSEQLSDRRFVKVIHLMKVSAASNGRDMVDYSDVLLLKDCLWNKPENRQKVSDLVINELKKHLPQTASGQSQQIPSGSGVIKGYQGAGTKSDPILIETIHHLKGLERPEIGQQGYYFLQVADIDCSSLSGNGWFDIQNFSGYYNGDNHTISDGDNQRALFAKLSDGEIKNVYLVNLALAQSIEASNICYVTNCHTNNTLVGIAGNAVIRHCSASRIAYNINHTKIAVCRAKVLVENISKDSTMTNCEACYDGSSTITGSFGLVAGKSYKSSILNCYGQGDFSAVTTSNITYMSGIVGFFVGGSEIRACALGSVTGNTSVFGCRIARRENSSSTFANNISISSNTWGGGYNTANGKDGKDIDPSLFNQYYFETNLGWDFDSIWRWNEAENRPELQFFKKPKAQPKSTPAQANVVATDDTDSLATQLKNNLWTR